MLNIFKFDTKFTMQLEAESSAAAGKEVRELCQKLNEEYKNYNFKSNAIKSHSKEIK